MITESNSTNMLHFIQKIHIDNLVHLKNMDISIPCSEYPHLIITGKNGSGKTVLLQILADLLQLVARDSIDQGSKMNIYSRIPLSEYEDEMSVTTNLGTITCKCFGTKIVRMAYNLKEFVFAFYQADRSFMMIEPNTPQKPIVITDDIHRNSSDQFINFLVDLKFQELLAVSDKNTQREAEIKSWFITFEKLLRRLFEDDSLTLQFSQQNSYSFKVCTEDHTFGFNEMSDGFKAALNIVADLILRMQKDGKISDVFNKEGVVLIDEIETHLHLSLQKMIMPFLTGVFPNIQFIVTTHSPFVLSSMPNAVAYDLEHQEVISNLTEYSYEALAEGYFGVKTPSSYSEMRLNDFRRLLEKSQWTESDKIKVKNLKDDFEKIPEVVSPLIVGEYKNLAIQYADKLMTLKNDQSKKM